MINLDRVAAEAAQAIVSDCVERDHLGKKDIDNLVTKALGVVQETGVYAGLLYLYSRGEADRKPARWTREHLLDVTRTLGLDAPRSRGAAENLQFVTDRVCVDLDTLLLVKQIWEQTLIYARYGAKALG